LAWRTRSGPQGPLTAGARPPARRGAVANTPLPTPTRFHWDWLYGIPLSFTFGVVVYVCLLGVQDPELQRRFNRQNEEISTAPTLRADWAADFPARIDQVTTALPQLGIPLPRPGEEPQGSGRVRWRLRRYELNVPAPSQPGAIETLVAPLRDAAPGVTVRVDEHQTGAQVQIGVDGLLTHLLIFQWLGRRPRAAIIVDDLGENLLAARALAEVDAPLTFAVRPFLPFSTEVAELARMFGRQVLVHLPIADDSSSDTAPPGMLPASATQAQVTEVLNQSLAALPKAVGVSNQSGAGFTADRDRMRWLLERLKQDALFFIDSQASASSVACEVAADLALPCAPRTLVVESSADERELASQLETLAQVARTRGDAIAIVHPGATTAAAVKAALPSFAAAGVDVVPASMIVLDESLSKR